MIISLQAAQYQTETKLQKNKFFTNIFVRSVEMNAKSMKIVTMIIVTGFFLVGLVILNGCKKEEPTAKETSAAQTQDIKGHGLESMTDEPIEAVASAIEQTTCPVMGSPINKDLFIEYKGKKVYFCCPGCEEKFKAEPEKYIAKLPQFQQQTQQ
jgi:YHS domain-containing protein